MKFGVIGGSLGGLIAAHALRLAGFEVDIFERSTGAVKLRGAGMGLQEPLADYVRAHHVADPEAITTQAHTRKTFDADGTLLSEQPLHQSTTSWEALWKAFHRVTPVDTLHTGYSLQDFQQEEGKVTLQFENGEKRSVDFMVAADGVHSMTRHKLLGRRPTYAGYVAWRGVIDERDAPAAAIQMLEDSSAFCRVPSSLFLAYLIPGPGASIAPGKRYLNWVYYKLVAAGSELDFHMTDKTMKRHEFSIPEGMLREDLRSSFIKAASRELPPAFARIVEATQNPFLQPIIDFDLDQMAFGRVALIGDAAFVIRPHTAASTYKAAVDGIKLAQSLQATPTLAAALSDWEGEQLAFGKALLNSGQRSGNAIMARRNPYQPAPAK